MDEVLSLVAGIMDDLKCLYLLHEDLLTCTERNKRSFEGCLEREQYRLPFVTPFLNDADR